jgi:ribonuclease-3
MERNVTSDHWTDEELEMLVRCEERLAYEFRDKSLLFEAITHASSSNTRLRSYERMEFLGDSILGFLVCEYLFYRFPGWLEGNLTKVKSVVVSRQTCAQIGNDLGLVEFLIVGKGIGTTGTVPNSLLANAFESIVCAIYLDGGWKAVRKFLLPLIIERVDATIAGDTPTNYKSELQQYAQKRFGLPPNYHLVGNKGPDHDKSFMVSAQVGKRQFTPAWGKNKKEAEQRAAANALAEINGSEMPYSVDEEE